MQVLSLLALSALALPLSMNDTPGASDGTSRLAPTGGDSDETTESFWPLADPGADDAHRAWRPVHDVVMGGISDGVPSKVEGGVRFAGVMRVEGGGFVSFRSRPTGSLEGADGVRIRVRGDGQTWKFSLPGGMRGVSWQISFVAPRAASDDDWTDVVLPFADFLPRFRGQLVAGADPLDPAGANQIGFTLADKQAGDYRLDVAAVEGWRAARGDADEGSLAAHVQRTASLRDALAETPTAEMLLARLEWTERVLVVAEPLPRGSLGARASIQMGRFATELASLADRDVRVVHLCGGREARAAGVALDEDATRALRERWELPRGAWACALVGKDGGVKERWDEPVDVTTIAVLIDAMPMRSRERERREQ